MFVQTFYPQDHVLKRHIEYYYFLSSASPDFNTTYYSFPNIVQGFNIHKNADCEIKPNFTRIFESRRNRFFSIVQGYYELPLLVNLSGRLDKITIIFKPLGFNHFIDAPFKSVIGKPSRVFTEWDSPEYFAFLEDFYGTSDLKKRVALLERFLLSIHRNIEGGKTLQAALDKLTDFDDELTVEEIARSLSLNVRTFNRLFLKHFGISPAAFKKIARFRHSLGNKLFSKKFKTLTEIGYESNFYDQSYFIKMYKNLNGNNPSRFFDSIEKLADERLVFKFIKK
jgi:AraC-like DNA-binding protein